jgi:hypothetical protein
MKFRTAVIPVILGAALGLGAAALPASADAALPGSFAYNDGVFGPVTCNETHHDTNNLPGAIKVPNAVTKGGYDEVQCTITNAPQRAGQDLTETWFSDFRFEVNGHADVSLPPGTDVNLGLAQVEVNGAGNGYHIFAWYPNN